MSIRASVWLAVAAIITVLAAAGLAYLGRDMWGWFLFAAVCFGGASSEAAAGRGDETLPAIVERETVR